MMAVSPVILIHGGAWAIPDDLVKASRQGVVLAARRGYQVLVGGGSAVDAVEAAVTLLEDDPVFDAGTGSVLTSEGCVEMDAVIMEGKHLNAGAVACLRNVANPVQLARHVMEKTDHTLLVGAGADAFSREMGVKTKSTDELVTEAAKKELEEMLKFKNTVQTCFRLREADDVPPEVHSHETVGAVALDHEGNVAFATSTGGITAKRPGRVGDSPIIGGGGYCDNQVGAVSTTGHGEAITKVCLAHRIISKMSAGHSAEEAAAESLTYMKNRIGGSGGVIVISNNGEIAKHFTTERMPWASISNNTLHYGINPGEDNVEHLGCTEYMNGH